MFDHVTLRASDRAASERLYDTVLATLGAPGPRPEYGDDYYGGFLLDPDGNSAEAVHFDGKDKPIAIDHLGIRVADAPTEHVHMAFAAAVDAFHASATGAGYRDNGAPGERPTYHDGYYAAFALDPDGHNVEVANHNR